MLQAATFVFKDQCTQSRVDNLVYWPYMFFSPALRVDHEVVLDFTFSGSRSTVEHHSFSTPEKASRDRKLHGFSRESTFAVFFSPAPIISNGGVLYSYALCESVRVYLYVF